jgi:bifunctional DNA-binding transcriptional regulator/antitoxin component of YhaV-PrlF toxin-antitoxin module
VDDKTWKKEYYEDCPDFLSFTSILDDKGRVLIPALIRKILRIKPDSHVSVIIKSLKIKKG